MEGKSNCGLPPSGITSNLLGFVLQLVLDTLLDSRLVPLTDWTSDTRAQGCTDLQSPVKCLDRKYCGRHLVCEHRHMAVVVGVTWLASTDTWRIFASRLHIGFKQLMASRGSCDRYNVQEHFCAYTYLPVFVSLCSLVLSGYTAAALIATGQTQDTGLLMLV